MLIVVCLVNRMNNRDQVRHGESVLETRGKIQSNPGNKYAPMRPKCECFLDG